MTNKRVRVKDIEVNYYEAGSGQALVFIHGMAESADSCWAGVLDTLSTQFHCYTVDLRGHGYTTLGDGDATLEQFGHDLLGFLDAVSGPATVVGFSLGATIALWAAAQQPTTITHVIAMGGSSVISRATAKFFVQRADMIKEKKLNALHTEMRDEIGEMFIANPDRGPDYAARRIGSIGEGGGYANAALSMARMREFPLQPELKNITCPVDVVGGENDRWCPRRASDIIMDGISPDIARYTEIPQVGHLMSVDDPKTVSTTIASLANRAGAR
jgi:3-oxoadipate enol-lactonase